MKTSQWIMQAYGYAVCLVAVITFLVSLGTVVESFLDLNDPLNAGWKTPGSPSLASFENYKVDVLKSSGDGTSPNTYRPDEQTLHSMYEAAKAAQAQYIRHRSDIAMAVNGLMVLIAVILFAIHWSWMRRLARSAA